MCSLLQPVCFIRWWLAGLLALTTGYAQTTSCIRLTGVVENQLSHQPVSARLYAQTADGRIAIGSSSEQTGAFSVAVPCLATGLFIQQSGYRPQYIPLRSPGLKTARTSIGVILPLLPVDAQDVNKPYQQTEQRPIEQTATRQRPGQSQLNQFTIVDALTSRPLRADVCFFFTKSGRRRCLTGDGKHPIGIAFSETDIVAIEVSSAGYQPYQGNLISNEPSDKTQQHIIRLTRELTLLSVQLDTPGYRCTLQSSDGEPPVPLLAVPGQSATVASYSLQPGSYTLTVTNPAQMIREQRIVLLTTGLNVADISTPHTAASAPSPVFNPDSLPPIYFEQSSFILRPASKTVLIQTAAYLLQHPTLRLHLVGHTDAEGDERLNQALSENRAKVVSSFLFSQGVPDARMLLSGAGSRHPAAPNDSEDHKSQNRRVQMRLVSQ